MISQLGKYEIRRELGRGAMGVVYEAYDPMISARVALKTIRPDQLAGEHTDDIVARFRREAQAAGRLSHPNIVSIYDCDEDAGTWFIAMEFVDGRDLKERFAADERFRSADIERIMTQILAALDYSHRLGVVHRDIKPANVFMLADGTVKVADFGIAHIESSNLTQVGTVVGTPNYMSPEQIMGLPVDGRSDLFSVGVILYQFLTGERPFAGTSTTTMQKGAEGGAAAAVDAATSQLPPAIDAVVRRALAKRADERFAERGRVRDGAAPPPAHGTRGRRSGCDAGAAAADRSGPGGARQQRRRGIAAAAPGPGGASTPKSSATAVVAPSRSSACRCASLVGMWFVAARWRRQPRRWPRCPRPAAQRPLRPPLDAPALHRGGRHGCRARRWGSRDESAVAAEDRSGRARHIGRRPRRSERSALRERQGAAAERPARRLAQPAGREGRSSCSSSRARWRRTTTCCKRPPAVEERRVRHDRRARERRRSSARTA